MKETYHCQCGTVDGESCTWYGAIDEMALVEWMPVYHRNSHAAAGNSGTYPGNGAVRLVVHEDCAEWIIDHEGDPEEWPGGCTWAKKMDVNALPYPLTSYIEAETEECSCSSCDCDEKATTTTDSDGQSVCDECSVYAIDEGGEVICSRMTDGFSTCHACSQLIEWGRIQTGQSGSGAPNYRIGACACGGEAWLDEERGNWGCFTYRDTAPAKPAYRWDDEEGEGQ